MLPILSSPLLPFSQSPSPKVSPSPVLISWFRVLGSGFFVRGSWFVLLSLNFPSPLCGIFDFLTSHLPNFDQYSRDFRHFQPHPSKADFRLCFVAADRSSGRRHSQSELPAFQTSQLPNFPSSRLPFLPVSKSPSLPFSGSWFWVRGSK